MRSRVGVSSRVFAVYDELFQSFGQSYKIHTVLISLAVLYSEYERTFRIIVPRHSREVGRVRSYIPNEFDILGRVPVSGVYDAELNYDFILACVLAGEVSLGIGAVADSEPLYSFRTDERERMAHAVCPHVAIGILGVTVLGIYPLERRDVVRRLLYRVVELALADYCVFAFASVVKRYNYFIISGVGRSSRKRSSVGVLVRYNEVIKR